MVKSHFEYGNSVWAPHKSNDSLIAAIEGVQRRATKLIHEIGHLSYSERLKQCGLPTLRFRRSRGDMIETFKILSGIYDINVAPSLELNMERRTRGNSMRLMA